MRQLASVLLLGGVVALLVRWYRAERLLEGEGTVYLQSEHEHFHLHVDLPPHMVIQPGDTVHILSKPPITGSQTAGEVSYTSVVQLHKASWLKRILIKRSSLLEINELVEHP